MRRFIGLYVIVMVALFTYVGLRLFQGLGWIAWIPLGIGFVAMSSYIISWRLNPYGDARAIYRHVAHVLMALLSFFLGGVVLRDLIFLPLSYFVPELNIVFEAPGSLALMAMAVTALAFGLWNVWRGPRLKRVDVPIPGLPKELDGYLIIQISDLHIGTGIDRFDVERVVRLVRESSPNMITLTGDIGDGRIGTYLPDAEPLRNLAGIAPTYYVVGNHEYYWDGPAWIKAFAGMGMHTLLNTRENLSHNGKSILVAGVLDPAVVLTGTNVRPDVAAAMGPKGDHDLRILLSHHPGTLREAERHGADLFLAGHTHGGQFFPWTLVVRRMYEHSEGLRKFGKMWAYVSTGTGHWGPPVRVGTVPELTLLRLLSI